MNRVPFQLPDIHMGLTEITGFVYVDEEFLVFEVEKSLLGEFKQDEHIVKVEPAALKAIWVNPGVFKDRLVIRPKKPELLQLMPGKHNFELKLKAWRKYRGDLEEIVEEVRRLAGGSLGA